MKENVPALRIRQPWVELIISGRKTVEVRTWTSDYRGKIWLHAGKIGDRALEKLFLLEGSLKSKADLMAFGKAELRVSVSASER